MVKAKINRHVIDLFDVLRLTHQNCPYLNLGQSTSNILITVLMLAQYFVKILLIGGNFHPFVNHFLDTTGVFGNIMCNVG